MSRGTPSPDNGGLVGGSILLLTMLVLLVLTAVVGGFMISSMDQREDAEFTPDTESWSVFDSDADELPENFEVSATTGYGAEFDASEHDERYIDAELGSEWVEGNWSVVATGDLAEEVNQQAAYTVYAYDNETIVLQWEDGEWLGYYNVPDSDESASVRVPASTDQTPVVLTWDDGASELTIQTPDHSDTATADTDAEQRAHAMDWVGMIDEVRVVNATMTAADTSQYLDEPVAPLPDSEDEHVARFMLDEGEGDVTSPYYHDEDAQLVGVGWTSGLSGPNLESGTDYEISVSPLEIRVLEGGFLDGAPVGYATWGDWLGFGEALQSLSNIGNVALTLFAVGLIIIAGVSIVVHLNGVRDIAGGNNRR